MPTGNDKFNAAAKEALCHMLSSVGGAAASYAAWGLLTPGPFDEWGALGVAGIAGLAYAHGCQWDKPPDASMVHNPAGCWKVDSGNNLRYARGLTSGVWINSLHEHISTEVISFNTAGIPRWKITYKTSDGVTRYHEINDTYEEARSRQLILLNGHSCAPGGMPTTPKPEPYVYTDPDDGCRISVTFQGFVVEPSGNTGVAWKMEKAAAVTRATGGRVGGCNFSPIIVYQPPGGGPPLPPIPYVPGPDGDGGEPWWMKWLREMIPHIVVGVTKKIIEEIFKKEYPGALYDITSVCETGASGEPIDQIFGYQIAPSEFNLAVINRLDALEYIMQGLKDFKQPICKSQPAHRSGEWVTVNFASDEASPGGDRPLRKKFRYLDQTSSMLGAHADHWDGFTWEAGPVCVIHKGAAWGVPQVWAASVEEGKRVIRHAGVVAGVDPDASGEWLVTGSSDPRYGMSGTMRLATRTAKDGSKWLRISKRDSPNGLPLLPSA